MTINSSHLERPLERDPANPVGRDLVAAGPGVAGRKVRARFVHATQMIAAGAHDRQRVEVAQPFNEELRGPLGVDLRFVCTRWTRPSPSTSTITAPSRAASTYVGASVVVSMAKPYDG